MRPALVECRQTCPSKRQPTERNRLMQPDIYPLRFRPIMRRYIWGGRHLGTMFGKAIGTETDYAESWELVDRPQDQSVVAFGPLTGQSLHELLAIHGKELLGRNAAQLAAKSQGRFPLLIRIAQCATTPFSTSSSERPARRTTYAA